jgi:hypothetical protein
MSQMEIHYAQEWAALYVDGQLVEDTVGDTYHAVDEALERAGVKQVYDDAFMRGQTGYDGVAKTLVEVETYRLAREERLARAVALRADADALLSQAKQLEAEH